MTLNRPSLDPFTERLHRQPPQHGPVMLMYHAVLPTAQRPRWPWAVALGHFVHQLDFLREQGYATPTVSELLADPTRYTGRTALITFDDGYVGNLDAASALAQRGMRATWYVVSGSIGRAPQWPFDGRPDERLMDAAELHGLLEAGMEIGSHSVSHRRLTELDPESRRLELVDSKASLEQMLGTEVRSFAYPYGAFSDECARDVQRAGYRSACTTLPGWALRDRDAYQMRRLTVFNSDSISTLARKLSLGSHDVGWGHMARYAWRSLRTASA
jgi:peptidoglycan/xylan/chitin deacetylase (PgdA/CDA1 family)